LVAETKFGPVPGADYIKIDDPTPQALDDFLPPMSEAQEQVIEALIEKIAHTKRTWQPKKLKRRRKHGFLERLSTPTGRRVLRKRKQKKRKYLTI
jgi:large subunit ribosomal protein L34